MECQGVGCCYVTSLSLGEEEECLGAEYTMPRQIIFPEGCQVSEQECPYHSPCTSGCTFKPGLWFAAGRVRAAAKVFISKDHFKAHFQIYRMCNAECCAHSQRVPVTVVVFVCVRLWVCSRERRRECVGVCVCFHLLHNREWRQSVLPCLPHYKRLFGGSERGHSLPLFHNQDYFWLRHSHYITERDTGGAMTEVASSRRCLMSDK